MARGRNRNRNRNRVKLRIDEARCQGHGRCWDLAPALIESDEIGRGVVIVHDVEGSQLAEAQVVVDACPERAVSLDES